MSKRLKTDDKEKAIVYQLEKIQQSIINLAKPFKYLNDSVIGRRDISKSVRWMDKKIELLEGQLSSQKIFTGTFIITTLIVLIALVLK